LPVFGTGLSGTGISWSRKRLGDKWEGCGWGLSCFERNKGGREPGQSEVTGQKVVGSGGLESSCRKQNRGKSGGGLKEDRKIGTSPFEGERKAARQGERFKLEKSSRNGGSLLASYLLDSK